MSTRQKQLTITLTPDVERHLDVVKRDYFYNHTRSHMIRTLIVEALDSLDVSSRKNEQQEEGKMIAR